MRSIYVFFTCLLLSLGLAACGPMYKTNYDYVPPHSGMGKMCIAQCVQAKNTCKQQCQMNKQDCKYRSHETARHDYRDYKHDRKKEGKEVKKELRDFDRSQFDCNQSCGCKPTFNACYEACGGKVVESKVCTAFCDK